MVNRLSKHFSAIVAKQDESRASGSETGGLSNRMLAKAAEAVGNRPVATLGVAFAMGVLLGKMVKR